VVAAFVFGGGVFELKEASLCSRDTFVCGWCAFFCFVFFFCPGFGKQTAGTDGGREGRSEQTAAKEREREKSIGMAWGMVGVEEWAGWVMVKHGCGGIW